MNITHRTAGSVEVIELHGRFDAYEAPSFTQWLEAHPETLYMVVNLSDVEFIDSSGLAVIVKGLKQCRQNGGDLCISNLQQAVLIIFELTRLDKAFKIFDDESEALDAIANQVK